MVSIRFTSFVVVLMFIIRDSSADIHQVTKKITFDAGSGFTVGGGTPAIGKDILDAVPTPQAAKNGKLDWRKKNDEDKGLNERNSERNIINNEEDSKISGAAAHKGKRKPNIECKMSGTGSIHHHMGRVEVSSFVALNADYHAPKSHPPKNN